MLRTSFSYDNFASLDSNDQTKNGKRGFDKNAYSLIKRIKPHHTNKKRRRKEKLMALGLTFTMRNIFQRTLHLLMFSINSLNLTLGDITPIFCKKNISKFLPLQKRKKHYILTN